LLVLLEGILKGNQEIWKLCGQTTNNSAQAQFSGGSAGRLAGSLHRFMMIAGIGPQQLRNPCCGPEHQKMAMVPRVHIFEREPASKRKADRGLCCWGSFCCHKHCVNPDVPIPQRVFSAALMSAHSQAGIDEYPDICASIQQVTGEIAKIDR
jgi:hypothetical protein